jgi:hypothetical protein
VRSFENPFDELRSQLLETGFVWEKLTDKLIAEKTSLPFTQLVQQAVTHLRKTKDKDARLFAVFDQFEELIILQTIDSPAAAEMKRFLQELQQIKLAGFVLLLSVRFDYRVFLEPRRTAKISLSVVVSSVTFWVKDLA